jgi:hypothetical protein
LAVVDRWSLLRGDCFNRFDICIKFIVMTFNEIIRFIKAYNRIGEGWGACKSDLKDCICSLKQSVPVQSSNPKKIRVDKLRLG